MTSDQPRLAREQDTVEAMIDLYCQAQHGAGQGLCPDCEALRLYAGQRLQNCPYQEDKTTCAKCPIHCYNPPMRAQIRSVMRYAGPRMLYRHPIMAIQHLLDGRRQEPLSSPKGKAAAAGTSDEARS